MLWVISIICELFGRHTAYIHITMWKRDIDNPAWVGSSVPYEVLGPFIIRKPLAIEFYDLVVERVGEREWTAGRVLYQGYGSIPSRVWMSRWIAFCCTAGLLDNCGVLCFSLWGLSG